MRSHKCVAVCVAALIAAGLSTATAQAALPEFVPGAGVPFTATSGKSTLETASKLKVKCTADTATGTTTGSKTLSMAITFTGCVTGVAPCTSPGAAAGEIETTVLSGLLGYTVNPEVKEVGIDLSSPTGAPIAEYVCGPALHGVVSGSVIGQITPVNTLLAPPKHFTLKFKQKKGLQQITHLFAEPLDVLGTTFGGPTFLTGLTSKDTIKFAAAVEIKA
jgi:hypothetical protein